METKFERLNRLVQKMYQFPIFCGKYFYVGYNDHNLALEKLDELKIQFPKDKWRIVHTIEVLL